MTSRLACGFVAACRGVFCVESSQRLRRIGDPTLMYCARQVHVRGVTFMYCARQVHIRGSRSCIVHVRSMYSRRDHVLRTIYGACYDNLTAELLLYGNENDFHFDYAERYASTFP